MIYRATFSRILNPIQYTTELGSVYDYSPLSIRYYLDFVLVHDFSEINQNQLLIHMKV